MFSTPRRILIILILTTFFSLKGSILTKSDVESSATTILNSVIQLNLDQNTTPYGVNNVEEIYFENVLAGFVIHLDPEGFIMIPPSKESSPVQLAQFEGAYPNSLPPAFLDEMLKENVATMVKLGYYNSFPIIESTLAEMEGIMKNSIISEKNTVLWNSFLNGQNPFAFYQKNTPNNTKIKVLTTAAWRQSLPYNLYTPIYYGNDSNGERTVAGCTAIAQAIIMKYWEWPEYGTGGGSIVFNNGYEYETYEADFSTNYRWDIMEDQYDNPYILPDEADIPESVRQTAKAVFHNGVLTNMHYGVKGSSAFFNIEGMVNNFRYSEDFSNMGTVEPSKVIRTIKEQIDLGFPIAASWAGTAGTGHSFVIVGYNIIDIDITNLSNPDSEYNSYEIIAVNLGWGSATTWRSFDFLYERNFSHFYIDLYPEGYCGDRELPYDCKDDDKVPFYKDNCPKHFNPLQEDPYGVGIGIVCLDPEGDYDGDGVINIDDNCPTVKNPGQEDFNENRIGDACDDSDGDGVVDKYDNCRETYNPLQFFDPAQEFFSMVSGPDDYLCAINGVLTPCESSKRNGLIHSHPEFYITAGWTHMPPSWQPDHSMNGIGDACDNGEAYNGIFVSIDKTISETDNINSTIDIFGKTYQNSYVQLKTWLTRPNRTAEGSGIQTSHAMFQNFYCAVNDESLFRWGDAGYCTTTDGENVNRPPADGGKNFGYSHGSDPYPINPVRNKQAWNELTQNRNLNILKQNNELFCQRENPDCNKYLRNRDRTFTTDKGEKESFFWDWKSDICSDFYERPDQCIPFTNPQQGEDSALAFHYTLSTGIVELIHLGWRCSSPNQLNCCGNGIVEGNEQCDDGNFIKRDGCDDQCRFEYITEYVTGNETKKFVDPRFFRHKQVYNRSWRMSKNSRKISYYYTRRSLPDIPDVVDLPERFDKYLCYKCLFDRIKPGIIDIWRYDDNYFSKDIVREPDGRILQVFSDNNQIVWAIEDTGSEIVLKRNIVNGSGEWKTVNNILNYPAGLGGSSIIMLDGGFIIAGGTSMGSFSPNLYYASISADSNGFFYTEMIAELPSDVSTAHPLIVNEELYVLGNRNGSLSVFKLVRDDNENLLFVFEEINLANKPQARLTATFEADGSVIYVIGGVDLNENDVNKIGFINLEKSDSWIEMEIGNIESMRRGIVSFNGTEVLYADIESVGFEILQTTFDFEKMSQKVEKIEFSGTTPGMHCLDSIVNGSTVIINDGILNEDYCNSSFENYGTIDLPGNILTIEGEANTIYTGSENGIAVISIKNTDNPVVTETHSLYGPVRDIILIGDYLYAATGNGIDVFKKENDSSLSKVYHLYTYGDTSRMIYFNGKIYAGDGQGIKIISINNPELPVVTHSVSTSGDVADMALSGNGNLYLYDWGGIKVFSLADAENPAQTASKYYSCNNPSMMSYGRGALLKCGQNLKYIVKDGSTVTVHNVSGSPSVKDVFVKKDKLFRISSGNIEILKTIKGFSSPVCGNGIIESGEICDGDTVQCTTLGSNYTGGYATCNSACSGYNTVNCQVCDGWGC